jgi:3-oxoacyl-[acyl-carrier protein] reductase
MQLQGQVALVTGSGRGIGKAIALRFAKEGADIAVVDINREWAQTAGEDIKKLGRRVIVHNTDVSNYDQVQTMVRETVTALGKLDILVNNAGVAKAQPFLEVTRENWENHLHVHLFGSFYCAQAAGREMAKRKYGRIVNIASVAGLMGPIDLVPYGAAKAGIMGMTRAGALELADYGITINAIAPGPIATELLLAWPEETRRERAQHLPIARLGKVEEIAHAALFLASPESEFINGAVLVVDGGSVAAGAYMVEKYRRRKVAAAAAAAKAG